MSLRLGSQMKIERQSLAYFHFSVPLSSSQHWLSVTWPVQSGLAFKSKFSSKAPLTYQDCNSWRVFELFQMQNVCRRQPTTSSSSTASFAFVGSQLRCSPYQTCPYSTPLDPQDACRRSSAVYTSNQTCSRSLDGDKGTSLHYCRQESTYTSLSDERMDSPSNYCSVESACTSLTFLMAQILVPRRSFSFIQG